MHITRQELIDNIFRRFGVRIDALTDDAPLFSSGLLDSFNLVELITWIESVEGFRIGAADVSLENLDSVTKILGFVERRTRPP